MSRRLTADTGDHVAPARRGLFRGLAVLTATALATAFLPVAIASAAPTAGAVLTKGQNVLPGTGAFSVTVTNNKALQGLAGGEAINYVDILLPNIAGIKTAGDAVAPSGWTSRTTSAGPLQTYTFRGGSLAPGASLTFDFPGTVAAPSFDRTGTFEVAVSSDDGQSTSGATGNLTTTIRTLEVLGGSLGATAPAGVTDQSGTAGQTIDYALRVKNHARGIQTVTSSLSSNGSDTITQAASQDLASGAISTFTSKVILGGGSDRNAVFTGAASAPKSQSGSVPSPFEVQAPASLRLDAASFSPKAVTGKVPQAFTISASKINKPALTLSTGTLTLPTNVPAALSGDMSFADNASRTLSFGPAQPKAADGTYSVSFDFAGVDNNGFAYTQTVSLANALKIDSLAPVINPFTIDLPNDADGRKQTAASNDGDVLSIKGLLDDCSATLDYVRLVTNLGQEIPVTVSRTAGSCSFTGSVTTGKDAATTFQAGTSSFVAEAAASDGLNVGSAATAATPVDLVAPLFSFAETLGTAAKADRILVTFQETGGKVFGACERTQWKIDGELLVKDVLYSDGTPCVTGQAGPDNDRILLLTSGRDQDLQTNVTYTPGTRPVSDRATDRAGQDALSKVVATVNGVAPAAPQIVTATRTRAPGERETATFDEGSFFTNRTGSDLLVEFTGARSGYRVQVFDEAGNSLGASQDASDGLVAVPVGTTDGIYKRSLKLINLTGKVSEPTALSIVLDRVAPGLKGVAGTVGTKEVTVTFTEKLAGGANFAENWFVFENNPDQDPANPDDDRAYYQVGSVSGSGATRTLSTNKALAGIGSVGADYLKRSPTGARYVDRAGNALADTV